MKSRIAALVLCIAPISFAMAYDSPSRDTSFGRDDVESTGSVNDMAVPPTYLGCPMSSATAGNANRQNVSTQQYGQTSGGNRR